MKFNIGDIVKYYKNSEDYLVLATKKQPLNIFFLNTTDKILKIHRIEEFANSEIIVSKGFTYKLAKISSSENGFIVIEQKFVDAFENDIEL